MEKIKRNEILRKLIKNEMKKNDDKFFENCKTADNLKKQETLSKDDEEKLAKLKETNKELLDCRFDLIEILCEIDNEIF